MVENTKWEEFKAGTSLGLFKIIHSSRLNGFYRMGMGPEGDAGTQLHVAVKVFFNLSTCTSMRCQ